ncbi:short-chain dehydrogenase [Nonlabens sp. YIK11]|uniref:SDR family NAD(P)-dependent oxidoreductase n=1 Tax=Nonlabens sp. YIK11 TaxID=1453349 RepID=UPI0006DC82B2|nr:SDR family oxidoreductase [Nonlabens sp. YIK11]KQC33669.1 short-chain dehydrogenase [Nonlabens sp. YIK11]
MDIQGKNALITGSSRGVGQQIALGLARLGCNIIVHGSQPSSNDKTLELLESFPIQTYSVHGNLADDQEVKALIHQVNNLNIPIDILYNNAGIMKDYHEDIWSHSTDEWMDTYKVNVVAMYQLCAAFVPAMIENNFGRVVNVTSRISGQPQLAPYGASKWAVDKLSQDLAVALENTAVRLNYFDPTWLKTDLGGEHADNPVEAVLPGALKPVLVENDGPNGQFFSAL